MKQQNYKVGDRILIFAGLVILLFWLCSCSSRKVNKSKTETKEVSTTEATFKDSSKTVTKLESNTKIVDISQSDELVISPIDNTKEMVVNGKTYFNAKIRRLKSKNNITTDKSTIASQIKQNDVKKAVKTNKSKTAIVNVKNTDRKQFNFWWLLLLVPIYLLYRKFKGLPLF